jgi:hypothetical protein
MAAGSVPSWKQAGQSPFAFFSWQICHAFDTAPAWQIGCEKSFERRAAGKEGSVERFMDKGRRKG